MNKTVSMPRQIVSFSILAFLLLQNLLIISPQTVKANNNAQSFPFTQNWSNTGIITSDDDWSNVPGIVGYRGDGLTGSTGTNPQSIVADGTSSPIDVNANQTNPNTFSTGGVTEFHLTDPVVALQGSGTARAPFLLINLNTTGQSNINVAYNLRDIDGSGDNAVQPVALQYRVGNTGNFTNLPDGFVADASTGPNLATLVTPVSVTLPSAVNNQSLVQVRIITTDAASNDEWIGIDNISITGSSVSTPVDQAPSINAPVNPIATVNQDAAPFAVNLTGTDDNSIYNWSATAGTGVASVTVGSGQGTANVTYNVSLQPGFSGTAQFTASLSDNVNAAVTRTVNIAVTPATVNTPPVISAFSNPVMTVNQDAAPFTLNFSGTDDNDTFNWTAAPGTGISAVTVTSGQNTSNVTYNVTLQPGFSGTANFNAVLSDNVNAPVNRNVTINVTQAPPPPLDHVVISQVYGGGGNGGAAYQNDFVELFNPDTVAHDLSGWTIQYGSATGTTWQVQPLGGIVAPGEYYLIKLGTNGAIGSVVPDANINGTLNLSGTNGKVALVRNGDALEGCVVGDPVVDFVGYGSTANCREGLTNAPTLSNTTAAIRKTSGFTDTNVNGSDFTVGAPNPRRTSPIVELPPSVLSSDPRNNGFNAPRDASITVFFTEPVDVSDGWFSINCAASGLHNSATTASDGPSAKIIIPNVNFQPGEKCTVTVNKQFVKDSDLDDATPDTDQLTSNYNATFTVATGAEPAYPSDVHLTFGNPSNAIEDINTPDNYLMVKPEYTLSYNRDRGTPNWVSWHLASEWVGTLTRFDTFRADPAVPADWYRVTHVDYEGSGFDRGHMVPNADRDPETSNPINQATFLMSNMIPQAPDNNQGPWANMENYLRTLLPTNELYIVAGGAGDGGTGSSGQKTTIANGHVKVPAFTWKVALVIPKESGDDVARVGCGTRTIAVIMPNVQGIRNNDWQSYITTVDAVENLTGYDFFSNLPDSIESCVEAGVNGNNPPATESQSVTTAEDTNKSITLTALSVNNNTLNYTIVDQPQHGSLTGTGANRVYTPASNYIGTDSFTFRASSGALNSNVSTVTITVTEYNEAPVANADAKNVQEDEQLSFPASDLSANDNRGEDNEANQILSVTSVTPSANTHGNVTLSNGQVVYTPDADYNGSADFDYQVCDNGTTSGSPDIKCAIGKVTVTVNPVNDNPIASADSANTSEDTPVSVDVIINDKDVDGDSLSLESVGNAVNGTVSIVEGKAVFSPSPNYHGTGSFTYTVKDQNGGTASGNVTVTIDSVNDNPVASNDTATTNEDTAVIISVLSNDNDLDGDQISISNLGTAAQGVVSLTDDGKVRYVPNANVNGIDSFAYTVSDGNGGTATATVNVNITPINDAPIITAASVSRQQNAVGTISQIALVADIDNAASSLNVTVLTAPTGVSVSSITNNNGTISATVNASCAAALGANTVVLRVSDGNLIGTANLIVNVTPSNTPTLTLKPFITLSPPNHKYHTISTTQMLQTAIDDCSGDVAGNVVIERVSSDEAENDDDDGNTAKDIVIGADSKTVQLRSERSGNGNGRVYTVTLRVGDSSGNVTRADFKVFVPRGNQTPIDDGAVYTVNSN